jgi:23S rRNA pseudouridine1911/1915/1917 synthase
MAKRSDGGSGRSKNRFDDFKAGPSRPHQGQGRRPGIGADGEKKPVKRSKKDRAITLVFEDNDFLVASKPSGLLSVPIPNMRSANLLEALNEELSIHNEKAITVHRIDRYTSGLVVFAKNSNAHKDLVRQFLSHTPIRTYLALVRGVVKLDEGELIHFLKKVPQGFRNVSVSRDDPEGAMARLTFKVLERYETTTLVQINLDTGLKNQIRVQFAEFGHPLVGDRHYSESEIKEERIDRQALHSWKLELDHPRHGKAMFFEADIPSDMRRLIDFYKKNP